VLLRSKRRIGWCRWVCILCLLILGYLINAVDPGPFRSVVTPMLISGIERAEKIKSRQFQMSRLDGLTATMP
jgi:hypothetical protein